MAMKPAEDDEERKALLDELTVEENRAAKLAHRFDLLAHGFWWGALVGTALAAVAGFIITQIPSLKGYVQPWVVSLFATIAGALEIARTRACWRAKADCFYALRDSVSKVRLQVRYEGIVLAAASKAFTAAKDAFGARMHAINEEREARAAASHEIK